MATPRETINGGARKKCPDCGQRIEGPQILLTCAYYIGYTCQCGPYSRESEYFKTRAEAEHALKGMRIGRQEKLRQPKRTDRN